MGKIYEEVSADQLRLPEAQLANGNKMIGLT